MSIFETALAVGLKAGLKMSRVSLTYTSISDSENPIPLKGTQGKKLFKIQKPGEPVVYVESVDFLILVADLVIDDTLTTPQRGDEISRVQDGEKFTYKVLPMGKELPFFQYSDTGKTVFRIHTKLFKQEPA